MFSRIFNPRLLTLAAAFLFGAAMVQAQPPMPNSPTPPTKKAGDGQPRQPAPTGTADAGKKTKALPSRLARTRNHVRGYRDWSKYCWFPRYHCYGYYSSADRMWFYWYEPFGRYLPTRYLTVYPPTTVGLGPVSTATAAPAAGAPAAGTLPAGGTAIPPSAPAPAADAPADQ
jgi:hypothetical protein